MYMLEVAEPYIAKTEMTKNRTHQSYRWKQVAMSEDLNALKEMKRNDMRIINWNTLDVIVKAEYV